MVTTMWIMQQLASHSFPPGRPLWVSQCASRYLHPLTNCQISLSLVGFLMALYSYFVAAQLIKASIPNQKPGSLPSPHRVSVLLRMFNAEILILCTLCSNALRRVFWNRQAEKKRVRQPRYAKFTVIALASGLVARCVPPCFCNSTYLSHCVVSHIIAS